MTATNNRETAVHVAAQHNSVETLELLLQAKADPGIRKAAGVTPLWLCAYYNNRESMSLLLAPPHRQHVDVDGPSTSVRTLHTGICTM